MDFSQFDYAYAISGGIGSGKSSVCKILSALGYEVLDADKIAHQILENQSKKIIKVFGEGIAKERGGINRRALGEMVFQDKDKLELLQSILNPYIYQELFSQCQRLEKKKQPYFVEIALLFEQKEALNFKHKILIIAPKEEILQRVQKRDNIDQAQILRRIASQLPNEEKIPYASKVIENDGDFLELERKMEEWVRGL